MTPIKADFFSSTRMKAKSHHSHYKKHPMGAWIRDISLKYKFWAVNAVAFFTTYPHFAPEWRLFVTTGFCGGLTTFSTFSAEVVMLLQSGRTTWALGAVAAHLFGSLLMTFAGIATVVWLKA